MLANQTLLHAQCSRAAQAAGAGALAEAPRESEHALRGPPARARRAWRPARAGRAWRRRARAPVQHLGAAHPWAQQPPGTPRGWRPASTRARGGLPAWPRAWAPGPQGLRAWPRAWAPEPQGLRAWRRAWRAPAGARARGAQRAWGPAQASRRAWQLQAHRAGHIQQMWPWVSTEKTQKYAREPACKVHDPMRLIACAESGTRSGWSKACIALMTREVGA